MNNISELKELDREHKIITRMYLEKPVTANIVTLLAAMINLMWTDTVSAQFILITWGVSYLILIALDAHLLSHLKNPDFKKDPFFYLGFTSSNGLISMVVTFTFMQLIPHEPPKDPHITQFLAYLISTNLTQKYFTSKYFLAVHIKRIETLEKKGVLMYTGAHQLARAALDAHMKFTHGITRPQG